MRRLLIVAATLFVLGSSSTVRAGAKEDVAAATQTWVDAMNSHKPDRVFALYDQDAVLWGTRSPTLRDNPTSVRDYFNVLNTVPPTYKVVLDEQRIRVYGDIAIDTGSYTFSETREGKEVVRPARFTFVYRNRNGRWMIIDHHSSAKPTPDK
ncbi:MAG TPA: SgcJ/EcaC family oxidoreductase [Verrucomicrobiae bacterium]|nr:SgcJ/EcaC family oxidoreductase [Verrucomicrobiae bacterium]